MELLQDLQNKVLKAVATLSASSAGSAVDLVDFEGEIAAFIDVSAGSGNMTLDAKLTECDTSGGSYTDVASGAFTQVTTSASQQKLVLNSDKLKRFVKIDYTLAGTTPSFLFSSHLVGIKKYK